MWKRRRLRGLRENLRRKGARVTLVCAVAQVHEDVGNEEILNMVSNLSIRSIDVISALNHILYIHIPAGTSVVSRKTQRRQLPHTLHSTRPTTNTTPHPWAVLFISVYRLYESPLIACSNYLLVQCLQGYIWPRRHLHLRDTIQERRDPLCSQDQ